MDISISDYILAIVTLKRDSVGGQAPIFYAENEDEREKIALYLSKMMKAVVHDLENGTYVLVKH